MNTLRRFTLLFGIIAVAVASFMPGVVWAHSGGLDSNGGHYCREAGYNSGSCGPLDSYHCHESGCTDYDGSRGWGGPGGGGGGGGGGSTPQPDPESDVYEPAPSASSGRSAPARRLFKRLELRRERGLYTYGRDKFPDWVDANGDGCDTRQAVLIEESGVRASRTSNCTVTAGRWASPYDGGVWTDPSDVDIDHVVALKEAWISGAKNWSAKNRKGFANDVRWRPALVAVTDNVNQSKGERDPSEWLPSEGRCGYLINWVRVKYRWRLTIDGAELDTLAKLLDGRCGDRRVVVPLRRR